MSYKQSNPHQSPQMTAILNALAGKEEGMTIADLVRHLHPDGATEAQRVSMTKSVARLIERHHIKDWGWVEAETVDEGPGMAARHADQRTAADIFAAVKSDRPGPRRRKVVRLVPLGDREHGGGQGGDEPHPWNPELGHAPTEEGDSLHVPVVEDIDLDLSGIDVDWK